MHADTGSPWVTQAQYIHKVLLLGDQIFSLPEQYPISEVEGFGQNLPSLFSEEYAIRTWGNTYHCSSKQKRSKAQKKKMYKGGKNSFKST